MGVFKHITPPDASLFFRKNDPNDTRLGETTSTTREGYNSADFVILGLPQDEGVRRNGGRAGARAAPDEIRRWLYKLAAVDGLSLFDAGNTIVQPTLEETHSFHRKVMRHMLSDNKTVVVLGGGNDASYPDCAALADVSGADILAFNIDAHFDVRADIPRNSGTPYRQLLEEGHLKHFYEVAYQPFGNSPIYLDYLHSKGVAAFPVDQVREIGLSTLLTNLLKEHDLPIFWGLDMDAVRASDAPGVSALNPTGLTGEEFASIGAIAGSAPRTRVFEITEVNPTYDIDNRTCRLAAVTIWHFLASSVSIMHQGE